MPGPSTLPPPTGRRNRKKESTSSTPDTSPPETVNRKKVAIVGSGCAGIGALWALKDTDYEIHLFEKNAKLGGHTNTQPWRGSKANINVDTGFIVMNTATYPNFQAFLKEVGVKVDETFMTFSVSRNGGEFEWSGEGRGIFAQRRNLFRPRHWRMIFDIIRFNQFALDLLSEDEDVAKSITIGQYLDKHGYSQSFRDDYLIPMTAAVWSTSPSKASLDFPALTLIRFMWNHHLLSTLASRPAWLTIRGGAQQYIDAVIDQFPADRLNIRLGCEVQGVNKPGAMNQRVVLVGDDGRNGVCETFDHVVLACHGDEILPILTYKPNVSAERKKSNGKFYPPSVLDSKGEVDFENTSFETIDDYGYAKGISKEEYDILKHFKTTENICYLHSDLSLMPRRPDVWTSWNYLVSSAPSQKEHPAGVSLTYNMNILQAIDVEKHGDVLVTMNPPHAPAKARTQGTFMYRHPLYTTGAIKAQEELRKIQARRCISYCGAWTKYGFHEDGFSSGLKVAVDHLGAKLPFKFKDSTFSRGQKPELCWQDHLLRSVLQVMVIAMRLLEPVMRFPGVSFVVGIVEHFGSVLLDVAEHGGILK